MPPQKAAAYLNRRSHVELHKVIHISKRVFVALFFATGFEPLGQNIIGTSLEVAGLDEVQRGGLEV